MTTLMIACHGQGHAGAPYSGVELDAIAANVAPMRTADLPPRLTTGPRGLPELGDGVVFVAPGHDWADHRNREDAPTDHLDAAVPTRADGIGRAHPGVTAWARSRGWPVDQHGRPVNPRHRQLLADPRIGLCTGLGPSWRWGEQVVVDAVAVAEGHVALIERDTPHDGTIPALPGGYAAPADSGLTPADWTVGYRPVTAAGITATAVRELAEETGALVPDGARTRVVREIRPVSSPHTLNAWTVVYTVAVHLPRRAPLDGGLPASWVPLDALDGVVDRMWPDHRVALAAGVEAVVGGW
ncbi:NUDIX hydrolase [Actinokineospora bangkokensis]|uniref:Nudix hydrolase domain-containing protein n=1 Tax=Actinokineospora bangkokensis TaxID=1193682 RepID=A0A1Q9LSA2_9PSEU|nr:NUDIX hydrolase [Actinokineospora bangkokensis]OLR94890.1 hypothetical protein BJP25_09145 [Actinokineospora bangkokensis]